MKKTPKVLIGAAVAACLIAAIFILFGFFNQKKPEGAAPEAVQADKIKVFTSILPMEYFVQRIGGDRVDVQALVTPGSSPATYDPSPRQMAALSDAKIFFRIGVPFENAFIPKIKGSGPRIVDTRKGITLRRMKTHHHHNHQYESKHDAGGSDPHIWLNPRLVTIQARTITDALTLADPAGRETYENNLTAFLKDLDTLDAELAEVLAPVRGKTFMVFHPSWGYFADAYGLTQEPIEMEGKDPSGRQLSRIISVAKEEGVRIIFVQPQFSKKSAQRIAEAIGGTVLPIDPLARNYIANLKRVAAEVHDTLQNQE